MGSSNAQYNLQSGDLIKLASVLSAKFIVHHGAYRYDNANHFGWYLVSVPDQEIRPISEDELSEVTVITRRCLPSNIPYEGEFKISQVSRIPSPTPTCPPQPYPTPIVPPAQPYPNGYVYPPAIDKVTPAFYSRASKKQLASSFISVPNLAARDSLDKYELGDGRIVRVNDVGGTPRYYMWSKADYAWQDFSFDPDFVRHVEEVLATKHVIAGKGLAGGGAIDEDVVITHDDTGTGDAHTYQGETGEVINSVTVDEFGHITDATTADVLFVWDVIDDSNT